MLVTEGGCYHGLRKGFWYGSGSHRHAREGDVGNRGRENVVPRFLECRWEVWRYGRWGIRLSAITCIYGLDVVCWFIIDI